jgi:AcrR family transcriptional regulator
MDRDPHVRRRLAPPTLVPDGQAFGQRLTTAERRHLVIGAAARLFEARGFHGTSIQQIADEIGITKAAIYHYVDSKDKILYEIHDAFISTLLEGAEGVIRDQQDPERRVRLIVHGIFRAVADYRPYVRAFFRDFMNLSPEWRQLIEQKRDRYEELVEGCVAQGSENGAFEVVGSPRLGTLFLFGACNWAYQWMTTEGAFTPDDLADMWSAMLLKAFAPNGASGEHPPG